MIKACFIPRLAFRPSGTFTVDGMIGMDSTAAMALGLVVNEKHHDKFVKTDIITDDGTLNNWCVTYEGSHFALFECGAQFNPLDPVSTKGMREMVAEGFEHCYEKPFGCSWGIFGNSKERVTRIGEACNNYHLWMKKIKKTFDPNTVADPSMYIEAD
jgi:hypothetical protein